jgi:hypothetical protein
MKINVIECASGGLVGYIRLSEKKLALTHGNDIIDLLENLIDAVKTLDEYEKIQTHEHN